MYKKITHNIVEEHFDHPLAAQIKKTIIRAQIPNSEVFVEDTFKNNVSSYVNNYAASINKIIDSFSSSSESLITEFEKAFTTVDDLGNMTKPFFTSELGERLNANFRYILVYTAMATQLGKIGQDSVTAQNRITQAVGDIANAMTIYNTNWSLAGGVPGDNLFAVVQEIGKNINSKINAKVAGNTALSTELNSTLMNNFQRFGNLFVTGLVQKFPDRFIKTTPVAVSE